MADDNSASARPGKRYLRRSLSHAPLIASLPVILFLTLFIGLFWSFNEYQAYQSSIENITSDYNVRYRTRLAEELDRVIDFIDYTRAQSALLIEDDLRDKVQSAYTIASHLYSLNRESTSIAEMQETVKEVLRPIRWSNERGYYFAGAITRERIDLFSDEPYWEGKTADEFVDRSGRSVIDDLISIVAEKGAGIHRYDLLKPAFPGRYFSKISFVKYFEPFDWFIGAGIYSDDLENNQQREVVERVSRIRFGNGGDILGFRNDGTIIFSSDELQVGRSILTLEDAAGTDYGRLMLEAGRRSGEGYVEYVLDGAGDASPRRRLSYLQAYPEWNWIVSAGMFMDEMEAAIERETLTYKTISFRNVYMFIAMFIAAVFLMLLFAYVYSKKIETGIATFTDFFRQAADKKVKIEADELSFSEFETIGALANEMVEDRIEKELMLRRNELRLDTLLQLGMMEDRSLPEKYDFTLRRVIDITGSRAGYLALVNNAQTHLSLCSYVDGSYRGNALDEPERAGSRPLPAGGVAGRAVLEKTAVTGGHIPDQRSFPYLQEIANHLDLPVSDGHRIVLVGGVCDKEGGYDNDDVRLLSMLLEGLWLHVLRTCSEQELANLERQVIAVSQKERHRIGQDLHDGLCSHLSGIDLLAKALQQKLEATRADEAKQLGVIRDLIGEGVEKAGQLARGLYPVHVIEQGLQAAIEELIVEIRSTYRVECRLRADNLPRWVDTNIQTHLYYIVREAAFNAARHGRPRQIQIALRRSRDRFTIVVADDGAGFSETSTRKGMGLHTMKYRAKAIGASLTIEAADGTGATVTVTAEKGKHV